MANAVFTSVFNEYFDDNKSVDLAICEDAHSATEIAGGYSDYTSVKYPPAAGQTLTLIDDDSIDAICSALPVHIRPIITQMLVFWRGKIFKLTVIVDP